MKTQVRILLMLAYTCLIFPCGAEGDIYKQYFRQRTQISALVGDSKWIARYSANKLGEVLGTAFNKDVTGFFEFEGQLKPAVEGTAENVVRLSSYAKVNVIFSDAEGNIFTFDLFTPVDCRGGSYTHNNYGQMLSFFELYDYETKNKNCPYHYAFYKADPEILQAARLLVKEKSDFIKRLEQRLKLPFGFTYSPDSQPLKVSLVLENTPAWYAGLQKNDVIENVFVDYVKIPLDELPKKLNEDAKRLELFVSREKEGGGNENKILTLYRDTPVEARLFQPPPR
jgi:hypothetical protein